MISKPVTAQIHHETLYPADKLDLVQVSDVVVEFDGFRALDIHYFGVDRNELRVVIGPNGAGKTTLCDVISGKTRVSAGRVVFDDVDITYRRDTDIAGLGVGRKFQTPTVFESLTVYENMELALPRRWKVWQNLFGTETKEQREHIHHLLERVHLIEVRDLPAKSLSHGQRQWLEISMLMVSKPKLLLIDEPAAELAHELHVVFDHHDGVAAFEFVEQFGGQRRFFVSQPSCGFIDQ